MKNKSKIKAAPIVYISTPITGKSGRKASVDYILKNCMTAKKFANDLRSIFSDIKFYSPAENDLVVQYLYKNKAIGFKEILKADKEIIEDYCSGLIANRWENSEGVDIEISYAKTLNIPVFITADRVNGVRKNIALLSKFIRQVKDNFNNSPKELAIWWNGYFRN